MINGRALFFGGSAALILLAIYLIVSLLVFLVGERSSPNDLVRDTSSDATYSRSQFGGWIDADGNCLDTRNEILTRQSLVAIKMDESGCVVEDGLWFDVYSGEQITDAAHVDVDHVLSLQEAWELGAARWTKEERLSFANDPENLVVTLSGINRGKGSLSPRDWLPPNVSFRCEYIDRYLNVADKYGLASSVDFDEMLRIKSEIDCNQ